MRKVKDKTGSVAWDYITAGTLALVVIIILLVMYTSMFQKSKGNIDNINEGECPENNICTVTQCTNAGSTPALGAYLNLEKNVICCEKSCLCTEVSKNGEPCREVGSSTSCISGYKEIELKVSGSGKKCCCKKA